MTGIATTDERALNQALDFAHERHEFQVERDLTEAVILKIADKKDRMPFGEALRFSLNELNLYDKKRIAYRSAAAKYFSLHAAAVKQAQAAKRKPPKRQPESTIGKVIVEENGQYAFLV